MMTYADISPSRRSVTHPFVATIVLNPSMWSRFEFLVEDRPEVEVIRVDRTKAEAWTVYAACASRTVRDLLESNW